MHILILLIFHLCYHSIRLFDIISAKGVLCHLLMHLSDIVYLGGGYRKHDQYKTFEPCLISLLDWLVPNLYNPTNAHFFGVDIATPVLHVFRMIHALARKVWPFIYLSEANQ